MLNRSLVLTIALLAGVVFSSLVDAQEVQDTSVNFNSGPLYAWPAYVSITQVAIPVYAGEVISNQPFQAVASVTPRSGTTIQNSTTVAPQPTSGWTGSVNVPFAPAPGGC